MWNPGNSGHNLRVLGTLSFGESHRAANCETGTSEHSPAAGENLVRRGGLVAYPGTKIGGLAKVDPLKNRDQEPGGLGRMLLARSPQRSCRDFDPEPFYPPSAAG